MLKNYGRILIAPRATMRGILDSQSSRGLVLLPMIIGLLTTPSAALSLTTTFPNATLWVWILCAVFSVIGYWMYVHAYGIGYRWIGSWIGGQGTKREIQLCLAWTQVPFIYIGFIFLPCHFIFRDVLYPEFDMSVLVGSPTSLETIRSLTRELSPAYYIINTLLFIPAVVAYIISLKLLGEAHGFSAWKAFGVKLIAVGLHLPIFGLLFFLTLAAVFVMVLALTAL